MPTTSDKCDDQMNREKQSIEAQQKHIVDSNSSCTIKELIIVIVGTATAILMFYFVNVIIWFDEY